jgi:hypothetical protein
MKMTSDKRAIDKIYKRLDGMILKHEARRWSAEKRG